MKTARVAYIVDWLQMFCRVPRFSPPEWSERTSPYPDATGNHRVYRLAPAVHYIKGYRWQREVLYRSYSIASIACDPIDERHRRDGGAIKLANAVLYVADWFFILMDVLATLQWQPLNITRVDFAADFNYFLNGLDPSTFLRKYVTKNKASYLRVGSNKCAVYLIKEMRCTIFDSIRWGSRQSGVSVYMYNKTKELTEKKDKPWIREMWKEAQLSSTRPVWRVEISITSQGLGLKNLYSHMCHNLYVDEFRDKNMTRDMFRVYAAKYFRFLKTDPTAKRKRDLREVSLLDVTTDAPYKPIFLQESNDTGRMERIVSNKLDKLRDYIDSHHDSDKYDALRSLDATIALFNTHHNIKKEVSATYNALEDVLAEEASTVFRLPSKEVTRSRLHAARVHIDELRSKAHDLAAQVIASDILQPSCTECIPPPRAEARNGFTLTTSPPMTTPTP